MSALFGFGWARTASAAANIAAGYLYTDEWAGVKYDGSGAVPRAVASPDIYPASARWYKLFDEANAILAAIPRHRQITTKEDFIAWLRSLDTDYRFCTGLRSLTCPLAKYTGEGSVGCYSFFPNDGIGSIPLPLWAVRFVDRFDNQGTDNVHTALRIMQEIT